jgi:hypothetical protein
MPYKTPLILTAIAILITPSTTKAIVYAHLLKPKNVGAGKARPNIFGF